MTSNRKILVVGDSFATLDPEHSHWVDQWAATKSNLSVEHFGCPGNNAVNVVAEFEIAYQPPYDFDFVVFQIPDFFRTEVASKVNSVPVTPACRAVFLNEFLQNSELMSATLNSSSDAYKDLLPEYASKFTLEQVQTYYWLLSMDPEQLEEFSKTRTPRDMSIVEHTARLYESISPRWMFRSNLTALKYFNSQLKHYNIPCCFVLNPGHNDLEVENITKNIDLPIWHMNIRSENIGCNHVPLTYAVECAILFEQYNNAHRLFLVD